MSKWTKPELENLLENVVNELDLSDGMINKHGQLGTAPAELVRLVLERKDSEIVMLKRGLVSMESAEAKLKAIGDAPRYEAEAPFTLKIIPRQNGSLVMRRDIRAILKDQAND